MAIAILSDTSTGKLSNTEFTPVANGTLSDSTIGRLSFTTAAEGVPVINNVGTIRAGATFPVTLVNGYPPGAVVVMNGTDLVTVETNDTVLTALAPFGGFDGTNEWADWEGIGSDVDIRVFSNTGGTSATVKKVFLEPANYSIITLLVDNSIVPSNSVFFGAQVNFIAGSQFIWPVLTDNTGEQLLLSPLGVPLTQMTINTQIVELSYFLDANANFEATGANTLNVTIVGDIKDVTPFSFTPVIDAVRSTVVESDVVTLEGIFADAIITAGSGEYRIDGGTYVTSSGSVSSGQTVQVRLTTSAEYSTAEQVTLTVDTQQSIFTASTIPDPVVDEDSPMDQTISLKLGLGL